MADQEKEKKEDQVRVIDDADLVRVVDEVDSKAKVVRLDAPKVKKVEKKGRIAEEAAVAERVSEEHVEEEVARPFDPEEEWLKDLEKAETRRVPMGWFVLLGIVLLGIVGFVVYQSTAEPEKEMVQAKTPADGGPLGKFAEAQARKEAEAHFLETETLLTSFLSATTVEERIKYVRHAERVRPLMESFYKREKMEPITYAQIDEYHLAPLKNRPFIAVRVSDAEGEGHSALIEDTDNGQKVDWESFVCYQPISLEDFVAKRPAGVFDLRAYVREDYFHTSDFPSKEKHASFQLRFRGSEVVLNAYVERGTELEKEFLKVFPPGTRKKREPLILRVRFLEGGESNTSVLVEDLVSIKWAYITPPAEVAPKTEPR